MTFHRYEADGFALHLDESVPVPDAIEVGMRRFPRRRLTARAVAPAGEISGLRWDDV